MKRHRLPQQDGRGNSTRRLARKPILFRTSLPLAAVFLLTAVAFFIRMQGLKGADGDLGTDESRLALAAQGVLASGLPKVPSGRIYTRAMLSAYLMAPSLWMFGPHDFAARLPSAVVGALLIPVVFVLGRAVAGTAGGLWAAAFAVIQPDLIKWSGKAWMPSLFVLVFVAAAYLLYLGYGEDRPSMQLAGACGFVIALFVQELAVLLPMAVFASLVIRMVRRDYSWFAERGSVAAFFVFGLGVTLFVAMGLFLRMGTIAGSTAEFTTYIAPSLTLTNLHFYYHNLLRGYPLLLVAAALGVPLVVRSPKAGMLFLYMTMAVGVITLGFLLYKSMERYAIMLLPLFAIIAAWSVITGTRLVSDRWGLRPATAATLPAVVLSLVFGLSLRGDLRAAPSPEEPPAHSWLAEFQALGPSPDDLVLSDAPTVVAFYRGRVDYWARVENYERYSYRAGEVVRELYTGAVRIGNAEDLQRVADANPGRTLWFLGRLWRLGQIERALWTRLQQSAQVSKITRDGWVILRIVL